MYKEDKKGGGRAVIARCPRSQRRRDRLEGTAVVLIIDKSSSMEGRKMELARLSAIGGD